MMDFVVGDYAEIGEKKAKIKVSEVDERFLTYVDSKMHPIEYEGSLFITKPFRVRFGVLLTVNEELLLLKVSDECKLTDFNEEMSSTNALLEAFSILNLNLGIIDTEYEERILIVPEHNEELTPYIDAISEVQLSALKKLNMSVKKYDEDFQIAKPSKIFKDWTKDVTITDDSLNEVTLKAFIKLGEDNVVHIIYPLNIRLGLDEVVYVGLQPLGSPVFAQRIDAMKFLSSKSVDDRIVDIYWKIRKLL